ncbi:hypothetical protein [Pseudomonas sp.]|uniref:hypothetical protein n=1 Tax=Pseudomonas sp. TaxID=306 RepID=UPI003F2C4DC3
MSERRTRLEIEASIRATLPWSDVFVEDMTENNRSIFLNRQEAVSLYVQGEPLESIFETTAITQTELHRLIKRCLSIAADGLVWGNRALIPHNRQKKYERTAIVTNKLPEHKSGYSGLFSQLLEEHPDLKEKMISKILNMKTKGEINEFRIKPAQIHRLFLDYLKDHKHPMTDWPFNAKLLGIRTITTFVRNVIESNFDRAVMVYGEEGARAHLSVGTGKEPAMRFEEVLDAVEIDSHKIDAEWTIGISNSVGLKTYINIKRLNILVMVDRASTAILWYLIVYSSEVSASDVVRMITESLRAELPKPETNILNMEIKGDSGYPAEKFEEIKHALPSVLMPDNALSNLASAVSVKLRNKLGFSLCLGAPGHFEMRPNVERTFGKLEHAIFHRFPSTTGSNPFKGRAKNGGAVAQELKMEADVVEEIAYHFFAQHNAIPSEGICHLSPHDFIRQRLSLSNGHFIGRKLLQYQVSKVTHYRTVVKVTVKCYPDRGVRPFVQIDRVRYSSDILRDAIWLRNKKITVEIDEHDLRAVRAYYPDGSLLGMLKAGGKWSLTKHSRKTRKAINSLKSARLLIVTEFDDPVDIYLKHLAGIATSRLAPQADSPVSVVKTIRSAATELNRLVHETDYHDSNIATDPIPTEQVESENSLCIAGNHDLETHNGNSKGSSDMHSVIPSAMPDLNKLIRGL